MPFLEHFRELRGCFVRGAIGITVASAFGLWFSEDLFRFLSIPLLKNFSGAQLIGTGPAEAFMTKLKLGLAFGVIGSSPWLFFQAWHFIRPGLHEHERKWALPFVASTTIFFLLGISFCFFLVFPFAFQYFAEQYLSVGVVPQIRIGEYLSFLIQLLLVFGVLFELPIFSFLLARVGLLKRTFLVQHTRWAIVMIFVLAGILTPPDIITQILLAGPMIILYLLSMLVCTWGENAHLKHAKKEVSPESEQESKELHSSPA